MVIIIVNKLIITHYLQIVFYMIQKHNLFNVYNVKIIILLIVLKVVQLELKILIYVKSYLKLKMLVKHVKMVIELQMMV